MFWSLFGRKIQDAITETRKVRVCGVLFTIRRVSPLDYLNGSKVLLQSFDTHKTAGAKALAEAAPASDDKVKRHYSDVLVAGVVYPRLVHKKSEADGDDVIVVDDLFPNWEMVDQLYSEIMFFTYGKKKLRQAILAAKGSLK